MGLRPCNNGKFRHFHRHSASAYPKPSNQAKWDATGTNLFDGSSPSGPYPMAERNSTVPRRRARRHVLDVGEHPARTEAVEDLAVERALTVGNEVVDREAGDDEIELAEVGRQRVVEIVAPDLDPSTPANRSRARSSISSWKSRPTPAAPGRAAKHEREHVAVAGTEVEHPLDALGDHLEHRRVAVGAMRDRIPLRQIVEPRAPASLHRLTGLFAVMKRLFDAVSGATGGSE